MHSIHTKPNQLPVACACHRSPERQWQKGLWWPTSLVSSRFSETYYLKEDRGLGCWLSEQKHLLLKLVDLNLPPPPRSTYKQGVLAHMSLPVLLGRVGKSRELVLWLTGHLAWGMLGNGRKERDPASTWWEARTAVQRSSGIHMPVFWGIHMFSLYPPAPYMPGHTYPHN